MERSPSTSQSWEQDREGTDVKFVRHSGSFLPPALKLKAGYTWKTTERIEMASPRSRNR